MSRVCIMLTYVLDCQHMTTTSERTSERAERARAEQTPTTACDARTASPAAPAHAAALSCKMLACCVCEKTAEKLCCALLCWWRLLLPMFSTFMLPSLKLSKNVTVISTCTLLRKVCSRSAPG